jgi:hypothetical protein
MAQKFCHYKQKSFRNFLNDKGMKQQTTVIKQAASKNVFTYYQKIQVIAF